MAMTSSRTSGTAADQNIDVDATHSWRPLFLAPVFRQGAARPVQTIAYATQEVHRFDVRVPTRHQGVEVPFLLRFPTVAERLLLHHASGILPLISRPGV
jgi:hypothetical protein